MRGAKWAYQLLPLLHTFLFAGLVALANRHADAAPDAQARPRGDQEAFGWLCGPVVARGKELLAAAAKLVAASVEITSSAAIGSQILWSSLLGFAGALFGWEQTAAVADRLDGVGEESIGFGAMVGIGHVGLAALGIAFQLTRLLCCAKKTKRQRLQASSGPAAL